MAALPNPAWAALAVSLLAACAGVVCALAFARVPAAFRVLILGALICLLTLPAPPLRALPEPRAAPLILAFACARGLALVALFCIPSAASIPRGLFRAARAAGATPLRAWRDAVLGAVWLPALIGFLAVWLRQ